jgi:hypothetical protein
MIHQIATIKTKTESLPRPGTNPDLLKARIIQSRVKQTAAAQSLPTEGVLWSPITPGPYVVPITRWIE